LFNLIGAYRLYESGMEDLKLEGCEFIRIWVKEYGNHDGMLTFDSEILDKQNFDHLI
jgi:hypothetical protein